MSVVSVYQYIEDDVIALFGGGWLQTSGRPSLESISDGLLSVCCMQHCMQGLLVGVMHIQLTPQVACGIGVVYSMHRKCQAMRQSAAQGTCTADGSCKTMFIANEYSGCMKEMNAAARLAVL